MLCLVMKNVQVLADSVGVPCRLVKGQQYTGSDDVAMNFVKIDDGRLLSFSVYLYLLFFM